LSPGDIAASSPADAGVQKQPTRADWMSRYIILVRLGALLFFFLLLALEAIGVFTDERPESVYFLVTGTLLFGAISAFAERYRISIGKGGTASAGFIADFLAAALLGPLFGAVVSAIGLWGVYRRGQLQRTLFSSSAFFIVNGITGLILWALYVKFTPVSLEYAIGGVAAGFAYLLIDWAIYSPVAWLRRDLRPVQFFREVYQPFLPFHFFFLSIAIVLIYVFNITHENKLVFVLCFLPVLGLIYAFRSFQNTRDLAMRLGQFSMGLAASMIINIDRYDNYTAMHSAMVAVYSTDTAKALNLSESECKLAHLTGLLHDLGKTDIPPEVLKFKGPLNDDQWVVMREHSAAGQKKLGAFKEWEELGQVVLCHHERFDGLGYPNRLSGKDIPLLSRIVSVADCYSAMISDRPYRSKLGCELAVAEIRSQLGKQFDAEVAGKFLEVLETHDDSYRNGEGFDFLDELDKVRFLDA
jgi:putative nucleotidyltransferase with HDIG domain